MCKKCDYDYLCVHFENLWEANRSLIMNGAVIVSNWDVVESIKQIFVLMSCRVKNEKVLVIEE